MPSHRDLYNAALSRTFLVPFGAADITVTAGVGAWVVGGASASFITTTQRIVITEAYLDPVAVDQYDIEIIDTAGTPNVYATIHCSGVAGPDPTIPVNMRTVPIPAGTTIQARCQSAAGGNAVGVKLAYRVLG